jgi:hypothetical protein
VETLVQKSGMSRYRLFVVGKRSRQSYKVQKQSTLDVDFVGIRCKCDTHLDQSNLDSTVTFGKVTPAASASFHVGCLVFYRPSRRNRTRRSCTVPTLTPPPPPRQERRPPTADTSRFKFGNPQHVASCHNSTNSWHLLEDT